MELILGAVVSVIAEFTKRWVPGGEYAKIGFVVLLALAAAAVYTYFVAAGYWEVVQGTLLTAGAFYAYILLRFK